MPTMLLLLRVVHLPPAKYDKSVLDSKLNKLDKTEVKRLIIQSPLCSCTMFCLMHCRDLQFQQCTSNSKAQRNASLIVQYYTITTLAELV